MSNEALLKQAKSIKVLTGFLAGVLLVLLIVGIVTSFRQGFNTDIAAPFLLLLPIVILNANNLKEIQKELNSREEAM